MYANVQKIIILCEQDVYLKIERAKLISRSFKKFETAAD